MDGEEFAFYNTIVYFERNKHNRSPESPCRWPGKRLNAKAFSKYPNIVAFMRYSVSPYIITAAEIASVSPEKMTAVIEDNGNMTTDQLSRLANQWGCPVQYLESSSLLLIDPKTIRGKWQARKIEDLLHDTKGLEVPKNDGNDWVSALWNSLQDNRPVTYASYMFAVRVLQYAKRHPIKEKKEKAATHGKLIHIPLSPNFTACAEAVGK